MATNNKRKTTSSSSRGRKKPAKKQAAPIRREVGACVCLVLALLTVLCCFRIDAAILNLLGSVFRGLIGAGFYILPFSFVMSFLILILHDGRPVSLRVTCTFLTAALVGSLVQLVGGSFDAPEGWEVVTALWDGGISGTAGGVLSGGLASLLAALITPDRRGDRGDRRDAAEFDHEPQYDGREHRDRHQEPAARRICRAAARA